MNKTCRCEPFDSTIFKAWIMKGMCPANPAVRLLFNTLKERGFKLFLLTGRDQATLSAITTHNLHTQGFVGYQRLILRYFLHKNLLSLLTSSIHISKFIYIFHCHGLLCLLEEHLYETIWHASSNSFMENKQNTDIASYHVITIIYSMQFVYDDMMHVCVNLIIIIITHKCLSPMNIFYETRDRKHRFPII